MYVGNLRCVLMTRYQLISQLLVFESHGQRGWTCKLCASSQDSNAKSKFMTAKAAITHEQTSEVHIRNVVCEEAGRWEWSDTPHAESSEWPRALPISASELKSLDVGCQFDHVRDSHIIPFWIRGVEAAEQGEIPRMEDLLENLPKDPWTQGSSDSWEPLAPAEQWGNATFGDEGRGWGCGGGWTTGPDDPWGVTSRDAGWRSGADAVGWGVGDTGLAPGSGWGRGRKYTDTSSEGYHPRSSSSRTRPNMPSTKPDQSGYRLEADGEFLEDIARQEDATAARKQIMHAFAKVPLVLCRFFKALANLAAGLQLSTQEKITRIHDLIQYLRTLQT